MGWDKVAALGADSHEISGEHFGIMLRPEVEHLAEQLRACLDRAQANTP
jgi:aspartate racemase